MSGDAGVRGDGGTDGVDGVASWSPGVLWPSVQIAIGIGAVTLGILRGEPLGLLLTGLAALMLIPYGTLQLLRRPRIEVVDDQLAVKKLRGVVFIPRPQVVEVRALGMARWGARQHMMRIEYTDERGREQLDVFTRADLGTDPRDVVEELARRGF